MIAGPITDAQIFYKPSKDLVKFIKSLKLSKDEDIPSSVLNIASNKSTKSKSSKTCDVETIDTPKKLTDYPSILKTSDIEYLNSLNLNQEVVDNVDINFKPVASTDHKATDKLLNFDDLMWLHKFIEMQNESKDSGEHVYFHQLFQGTEIILPRNEEIERSEELEARCVKLRNQQKNREYKMMTKNVDNSRQHLPEETISYQIKQINSQLIAVFQFVISVLAGFLFGFMGLELMIGAMDFGFRLLLGIICALTIALAELYFLAKKLNEDIEETYKPTAISSQHHNSKVKSE